MFLGGDSVPSNTRLNTVARLLEPLATAGSTLSLKNTRRSCTIPTSLPAMRAEMPFRQSYSDAGPALLAACWKQEASHDGGLNQSINESDGRPKVANIRLCMRSE